MAESNGQKQATASKLLEKRIWNRGGTMRDIGNNRRFRDPQVAFDNAINNGLIKNQDKWIYICTLTFKNGENDIFQKVNSDDSNPNNLVSSKVEVA